MKPIAEGLHYCQDGKIRCFWAVNDAQYQKYHDLEWGRPQHEDRYLFEKICLEGFQSGLSWLTILRKRENFRTAFDGFDFYKIAQYDDTKINDLLYNEGIIRHKGKILATINNAQCAIKLLENYQSLDEYFWSFQPQQEALFLKYDYATIKANPTTAASEKMSKDLKKRGFKFVGPTTCYAFMQSVGIVNDHLEGCDFRHN